MKKKEVILIGAGGHCLSVIEAIESTGEFNIAGLIDPRLKKDSEVLGYPVLGDDHLIPELIQKGYVFHITVGNISMPDIRINIYNNVTGLSGELITTKASTTRVSSHASIGNGCTLLHYSFVNTGAKIGKNCILNTGALVEHESIIGDHCHLSTYAKVNGQVTIGSRVFIGSNATIFNNVTIGDDVTIGAGAVVTKDIKPGIKVVGNPAKSIKNP